MNVDQPRNIAMCLKCWDVVESKYQHHYVACRCGAFALDGGRAYWKAIGDLGAIYRLSEQEIAEHDVINNQNQPEPAAK